MNVRPRWTILDVDESVIERIKRYSKRNGVTLGRALKEMIKGEK